MNLSLEYYEKQRIKMDLWCDINVAQRHLSEFNTDYLVCLTDLCEYINKLNSYVENIKRDYARFTYADWRFKKAEKENTKNLDEGSIEEASVQELIDQYMKGDTGNEV